LLPFVVSCELVEQSNHERKMGGDKCFHSSFDKLRTNGSICR